MVLVSHDHKFIFLKTRKTASTSVEMYLQPFCTPDGHPVEEQTHTIETRNGVVGMRLYERPRDPDHADNKWFNHMGAAAIRKNLGRLKWWRYLKITTIRNPFDRMVSAFHYDRKDDAPLPNDIAAHRDAFRRFVLSEAWKTDEATLMIDGRPVPDFVVRYEHLEQDLDRLARKLRLDVSKTHLPKTKVLTAQRQGFSVADYYDDDTINLVRAKLPWYFEKGAYAPTPAPV